MLNSVTLCTKDLSQENSRDNIKLTIGRWLSLAGVHYIMLDVCDVNRFPVSIILLGKHSLISVSELDLTPQAQRAS